MAIRAAAVVYGPDEDAYPALAACAAALQADGLRVAGLLQRYGDPIGLKRREIFVVVLPTGETLRLDERRGSGAEACILDGDVLTRLAVAFQAGGRTRPDVMIGRFGKEEAAGRGLRREIADVLMDGTPLMVSVRRALLPAWQDFLQASGSVLKPELTALLHWVQCGVRGTAAAS